MKYAKPEVVVLDNAISIVQMSKTHGFLEFEDPSSRFPTIAAYPSDE
jgi:hypothetical protein